MFLLVLKNILIKSILILFSGFLTFNSLFLITFIIKEVKTEPVKFIPPVFTHAQFQPTSTPNYNSQLDIFSGTSDSLSFNAQDTSNRLENTESKRTRKYISRQIDPTKKVLLEEINASCYGIYELNEQKAIINKNQEQKVQIASLTKLFSMYVATKYEDPENSDLEITITGEAFTTEGNSFPLLENSKYSFKDAYYTALINSNNQAVIAIEQALSENHGVNLVNEMNNFKKLFRLNNTNFANTVGFDDEENYSTVDDIAKFLRIFVTNSSAYTPTTLRTYEITNLNPPPDLEPKETIINSNDLLFLGTAGVVGGKTGTTFGAGENLVLFYKSKRGIDYHIIILNSSSRYEDAYKLLEFIETNKL